MRKEFKKSYLVINIILSLFIVFLLINVFVIKNINFLFSGISTAIVFFIMFFIYGYEKKNKRFTYETMFYIIAYTIMYIIATYIVGIFSGFNSSIYSLSISNIVKNIIPYIIVIASGEFLRAEVTRKCENSWLAFGLVTIAMIIIDCTLFLTTFNLGDGDGQIKFICNIVLPSISKNLLLLYISKIGGVYPTIIYRVLMELKMFIIPIVPDYGLYIDSVLSTVVPFAIGISIFFSLKQYENKEVEGKSFKQSNLYIYSSVILTSILIVIMVSLNSCKFKYGSISIGSGSMTGTINKGDVVIYKAIGDYEPQVDEILVFRKENKIIVHRIIEIVEINDGEKVYYTKGDANQTADGYPLLRKDLIGVVKGNVRYLGLPSVLLHELITR